MTHNLDSLIEQLAEAAKLGVRMTDHQVLRALRVDEIRTAIEGLLEQGYSLNGARALPSRRKEVAEVLFTFTLPPGSAALGTPALIGAFDAQNNNFVSVSGQFNIDDTPEAYSPFGVVPFALATPSFTEAAAVVGGDPKLQEIQSRREELGRSLGLYVGEQAQTPYATSSLTPFSTPMPTAGLTTPNDNDNFPDPSQDYNNDTSTDYRNDAIDNPATSSTTPYATSSLTPFSTPMPTAGLTTPNDNDNFPDPSQDYNNDTSTDYRDDA